MEIQNRKARHNYFIKEEYECGIVLKGTEIKAIREGSCNIEDSYGHIKKGELFILNMFIGEYKQGNIFNHQETRTRKLLMHKNEILKINEKIKLEGYTLIPLRLYFKKNVAKISLGLCKGKKDYDKRETIKERDIERELQKKYKN
jgi:SsrA-binding protein